MRIAHNEISSLTFFQQLWLFAWWNINIAIINWREVLIDFEVGWKR